MQIKRDARNIKGSLGLVYALVVILIIVLAWSEYQALAFIYGVQLLFARLLIWIFKIDLKEEAPIVNVRAFMLLTLLAYGGAVFLKKMEIPNPLVLSPDIEFLNLIFLAPPAEELFFRGAILNSLLISQLRPTIAKVISSMLFSAYHLIPLVFYQRFLDFTVLQAMVAFVLGLYFASNYMRTKSLLSSIIYHGFFNAMFLCFTCVFA